MTTRFRRPMLVLGTTILIMQAVFMPVGMVYAETTMDTEEQELVELPPMKNYLEEEQISDPRFFFTRSRMQGTAEEPLQVTFFSDQEVSEARVFLPEEATLLEDQLPTGISVEEGVQPNEWIVQSKRVQNTFVLPLVVEQVGNYELSVEETTAHLEISEKEETSEEVPVEATESSDEDEAGQEELKEENGIEEENEQPAEEVREPVSEAPQEQQTNEEESAEASQVVEPTVFDGETAEVATMAEFREAVGNPDIGIISVQANLTEATANVLTVDRPLLIQGNGYTLTFGINGFYFQLEEVTQASTIRLENATLTKVGVTPLINATVENSKNWTIELEDITEVNANTNTMRLASLPEGSIHFTGGVSNFTRTASAQTFIEAKEVLATNQAEVTISRGNATVFFSSATVADPKLTVEQGATVTITTTAGVANTIDLRGEKPEVYLQSGELDVATVGTTAAPTDTTNNTIALTGTSPKLTINSSAQLTVRSTLAKRGIQLAGNDAQLLVNNSELSVTSATQAAINITGESPQLIFDSSVVNVTSTTGQRMNLIGSNPVLNLKNSQLDMSATTGRGVYLQGITPQVKLDNSQLLVTDTSASQGMILQGTDALLSLSNKSELSITGAATGALENIQIGNNNARPELSITGESKVSVTTTSGTGAATDTANNAIHLRGADPKATIAGGSELEVSMTSGARRGLYLNGDNANLSMADSLLGVTTINGQAINLTGNSPTVTMNNSDSTIDSTTGDGVILNGRDAQLSVIDSTMRVENSYEATGLGVRGGGVSIVNFKTSTINMVESKLEMDNNGEFIVDGSTLEFNAKQIAGGTLASDTLKSLIRFNSNELNISITNGTKMTLITEYGIPIATSSNVGFGGKLTFHVSNNSELFVSGSKKDNHPAMLFQLNELDILIDSTSMMKVENSGESNVIQGGNTWLGNQGIYLLGAGRNPRINITVPGDFNLYSEKGPGIAFSTRSGVAGIFDAQSKVTTNASFLVRSGVSYAIQYNALTVEAMNSKFSMENPLFYDIISAPFLPAISLTGRPNYGDMTISKSKFSAWGTGKPSSVQPDIAFAVPFDARITGNGNFDYVESSTNPEFTTETLGTQGLNGYSRISGTNASWAIVDELRVPTNADKKIHGRVSLPVGLDDSRPAWDDEAMVTVEVESPSGETTQEYTAKTVGDTNESPGISIYGEEPRGGLFEIDLDKPLEAGSKVRVSKVELTSGELADGFEHQILTDTVEVFPIIPPTPAQFSSSIIAQDSNTIQGTTDNLDAEVTATHNGEPLNTEAVKVDDDGRFTLDLSEVSLEMDDEIQVFLRDVKGSALAAGVVNPPETNNTRGNINPSTELTFHDVTFESATTLTVGDLGPVSPVDPLDPEIEVDPENKPVLPEDQGQLSIDFISAFNFGSQAISAHDQTYYAQPQRLLNEDGTVNENEERPNYVQISDRRLENDRNGWTLAVTQKEQFKGAENQVLNGASLSLSNQQVITAQGGTAPGLQSVPCTLVPGNRRTLLQAQGSEGTGTWIYRFGDGETAGESVALNVPRGANPEATNYSSTLIWELSAVPGN